MAFNRIVNYLAIIYERVFVREIRKTEYEEYPGLKKIRDSKDEAVKDALSSFAYPSYVTIQLNPILKALKNYTKSRLCDSDKVEKYLQKTVKQLQKLVPKTLFFHKPHASITPFDLFRWILQHILINQFRKMKYQGLQLGQEEEEQEEEEQEEEEQEEEEQEEEEPRSFNGNQYTFTRCTIENLLLGV